MYFPFYNRRDGRAADSASQLPASNTQNSLCHAVLALIPSRIVACALLFPSGDFNGQAPPDLLNEGEWTINGDVPAPPVEIALYQTLSLPGSIPPVRPIGDMSVKSAFIDTFCPPVDTIDMSLGPTNIRLAQTVRHWR